MQLWYAIIIWSMSDCFALSWLNIVVCLCYMPLFCNVMVIPLLHLLSHLCACPTFHLDILQLFTHCLPTIICVMHALSAFSSTNQFDVCVPMPQIAFCIFCYLSYAVLMFPHLWMCIMALSSDAGLKTMEVVDEILCMTWAFVAIKTHHIWLWKYAQIWQKAWMLFSRKEVTPSHVCSPWMDWMKHGCGIGRT